MNTATSILDVPLHNLTPGMRQYREAKEQNPDCIIMLRMGDFYEMFYEDAVTASRELDITLTARGKGDKRAPLAGVPYHAGETYIGRFVKKGFKVAIIEQLEDPKKAKGLVKRGLVRIVTPGTVIDQSMLTDTENNYIAAITQKQHKFALAVCDISTGEFVTHEMNSLASLQSELTRYSPQECIFPESLLVNDQLHKLVKSLGIFVQSLDDYHFRDAKKTVCDHFSISTLDRFGLEDKPLHTSVAGALLYYITSTQKNALSHIQQIQTASGDSMVLDLSTMRNLELDENIRDNSQRGTLLSIVDRTVTSAGSRLIRRWIKSPLCKIGPISLRLNAVESLSNAVIMREKIISYLKQINDIERIISRVNYGNASPRDLLSLKYSLQIIPTLCSILSTNDVLLSSLASMPDVSDVVSTLHSIKEDAPITIREGGMIVSEYNEELQTLHQLRSNSKQFLQQLEDNAKKETGITALRIGFNRVFGYFFEVSKKNSHLVPSNYIRKQTTANSERYISEELKKEEQKILGAEEKIKELEYQIFQQIIESVKEYTQSIQEIATKISVLDVLCSFSTVSLEHNYCKPQFVTEHIIQLSKSRHPVVEQLQPQFVSNDICISPGEMMLITGPNMAGKSTIMRQVALIVLMAQIGSFVPATECTLGIVDRIFTRVGAFDDLSSGQSTFMVEMQETASILHNATSRSLIILDEIGRGTSTFDGVSIAWSVAEHIYNNLKAKTLFATHYHVMNKLEEKFQHISNYNIAVSEKHGELVFLHKLMKGGTDQSYGVHVAKLAGLPQQVIDRAKEVQSILEKDDDMMRRIKAKKLQDQKSLGEF